MLHTTISPDQTQTANATAVARRALASAARADAPSAYTRAAERRLALRKRAARLAPAALAAATTDTERALIASIFAAIPGVLELSEAHSALEVSDFASDASDAAHDLWSAARGKVEAMADRLMLMPAESAAAACRRLQLRNTVYELIEFTETVENMDEVDVRNIAKAATKALTTLSKQAPAPQVAAWRSAFERYQTASAAESAETVRHREIWDAAEAAAPKPTELDCYGGIQGILNDRSQSPAEQGRLIDLWNEWKPRNDAAKAAAGWTVEDEDKEDEDDHLYDETAAAEAALIRTPAPDISALAIKLGLSVKYELATNIGDDIDDPRFISAMLASTDHGELELVYCYMDALRLAGLKPDVLSAVKFDPRPFIDLVEKAGFSVERDEGCEERYGIRLVHADGLEPAALLTEALNDLVPAQRHLVLKAVGDDAA